MLAWQQSLGMEEEDSGLEKVSDRNAIRQERLMETIYVVPFCKKLLTKLPFLKHIPVYPR